MRAMRAAAAVRDEASADPSRGPARAAAKPAVSGPAGRGGKAGGRGRAATGRQAADRQASTRASGAKTAATKPSASKPSAVQTPAVPFDPAKQALWSRPGFLVRRLNQIHYAMFFEECRSQNVTPVQYGILTALSLNPWLDQTQVGMELGLDRTTTADVLKRLEDRGFVERRVNPLDRRSRQAVITPDGMRVMGLLQDGMWRAQRRLLEPLSPRNQAIFMKLLAVLVEANNDYGRATLRAL